MILKEKWYIRFLFCLLHHFKKKKNINKPVSVWNTLLSGLQYSWLDRCTWKIIQINTFNVLFLDIFWLAVVFAAVWVFSCGIREAAPGTRADAWARIHRGHTDPETERHRDCHAAHTVALHASKVKTLHFSYYIIHYKHHLIFQRV